MNDILHRERACIANASVRNRRNQNATRGCIRCRLRQLSSVERKASDRGRPVVGEQQRSLRGSLAQLAASANTLRVEAIGRESTSS
jgi:predicted  nucleic acid-binding Zn-ribbon protein